MCAPLKEREVERMSLKEREVERMSLKEREVERMSAAHLHPVHLVDRHRRKRLLQKRSVLCKEGGQKH